jgi:hypothetical protein
MQPNKLIITFNYYLLEATLVDSSISKSMNVINLDPRIVMLFWHRKWQYVLNNLPIPCCGPWHCICKSIYYNGAFPPNKFQGKISKLLFNENKIYFLERLHLIFWKIGPFLLMPNRRNHQSFDRVLMLHTPMQRFMSFTYN